MSKEKQEPLLGKSPPKEFESKWGESRNTKTIMVHHWSEYDQGVHKFHEIEINNGLRVLDIIILSIQQFYPSETDPSQFFIRLADKSGKPKTSMPVLDVGQTIYDTGMVRFALCSKQQDVRKSEKFEKFEDNPASPKESPNTSAATNKTSNILEQHQKRTVKKKFCCCFNSE
jgi:hypothetical protein